MEGKGTNAAERALALLATLSWLWLCLAWFDHDLRFFLAGAPPSMPFVALVVSLAVLGWRRRRRFSFGADERLALGLATLGFLTRLPFVGTSYGLFSSDASAQGVMALHILEGRHHPVFLYNWSYVGSPKAHLAAFLAWLTGEPVASFALAAALVYGGLTASVFALSRRVLPRAESVGAALYIVFAPGFLTAWGMGNEGNYPDVLALGTLMLALGARFLSDEIDGITAAFWLGILGGLAFWIHILATYYLIAAVGILVFRRFGQALFARALAFASGFVIGDFPGILWNATNGFLSFRWWALDASASDSGVSRLSRASTQMKGVFSTSFAVLSGFWPHESPPSPELLFRPLLSILIPGSFLFFTWKHRLKILSLFRGRLTPEATLAGFFLLVLLLFAQSSFGWMTEEPRYLLFLFSVVPIFLASAIAALARRSRLAAALVGAALVFVSVRGGALYYRAARESDAANRKFLERLAELDVRYAHSDYHLSYKYVFLSHGRMVWTSELGPSSTEWYLPFREEVAAAGAKAALVPRSYRFARRIERRLEAKDLEYRREDLLYPVLFGFSETVRPEDVK
jgi:hypothetical protein